MEWLAENWLWVVIGIAFVAMHLFGHGGHGGHGGHEGTGGNRKARREAAEGRDEGTPPAHRH